MRFYNTKFERAEMGNPHCIAPLLLALAPIVIPALLTAGATIGAAMLSSSSNKNANAENINLASKANAIQNQQWQSEMNLKKSEMNMEGKKQLEDWINQVPARRKIFVDIWSGGK